VRIKRSTLKRIIAEAVGGMEYYIEVNLPFGASKWDYEDPSFRPTQRENAKNSRVRKKIGDMFGTQIRLTGASTRNPNYKMVKTFSDRAEAEAVAAEVASAVEAEATAGNLVYRNNDPSRAASSGWAGVGEHDAARGPFWG
jgi:hypothetical protein